jgi:hypothetical protein
MLLLAPCYEAFFFNPALRAFFSATHLFRFAEAIRALPSAVIRYFRRFALIFETDCLRQALSEPRRSDRRCACVLIRVHRVRLAGWPGQSRAVSASPPRYTVPDTYVLTGGL